MAIQSKAITLIRRGLFKLNRPRYMNSRIIVSAFTQDKLLDPVRILKCYLKRSKTFRDVGQVQAKLRLFLTFY